MPETVSQHMASVCSFQEINQIGVAHHVFDMPQWPTDLFLVCASLLDAAGAYAHFDPAPDNTDNLNPPSFGVAARTRDRSKALGRMWRETVDEGEGIIPPSRLQNLWNCLSFEHGGDLVRERKGFRTPPRWWRIALLLMIAADEACSNVEHAPSKSASGNSLQDRLWFHAIGKVRVKSEVDADAPAPEHFKESNGSSATFAVSGHKDKRNVFPKCLVSESGCSHRNFSQNVTLLPNTGTVRCHWHGQQSPLKDDNEEPLDILLVPFPYEFSAKAFRPLNEAHKARASLDGKNSRTWANFRIDQNYFTDHDAVLDQVHSLVLAAKQEVDTLNGIILPELAVNFSTYEALGRTIRKTAEPDLEFLVSGSIDNCKREQGNNVLTSVWSELDKDYNRGSNAALISSRRKHHRWQLDASQIRSYGLATSLDPRIKWWEDHVAGFRELHFYPLRRNSIFTSLICEDLARVDPCHEVIRSVGPNLVFSLLMDGPQVASRWSARYARTLSEDPGCSVLTLTSYALLNRCNHSGVFPANETVAFFSSPFGMQEISLPYSSGARGILLNLVFAT